MAGVKVGVSTNVDQVLADLDGYVDDVIKIAAPRAVNRLRDQGKTAGFRTLADVYDIGPRTMDKYTSVTSATTGDLQAEINVKGAGFPLFVFSPRQTKLGVTIKLKGTRILLPHTFLAKMPNGHVGVFARGVYGGRFQFQRGAHKKRHDGKWTELPINELFSFAPSDAFSNPLVVDAMQERIDQQAGAVLKQEIRFAAR